MMPTPELRKELKRIFVNKGDRIKGSIVYPMIDSTTVTKWPRLFKALAKTVSYIVTTGDKEYADELLDILEDMYDLFQEEDLFYEEEEEFQANYLGRIDTLTEVLEGF